MAAFRSSSTSGQPASFAGKIFLSLFLAVFLGMGLVFTVLLGKSLLETVQSFSWPEHACVITRSEVLNDPSKDREQPYLFQVEYRYEAGGRTRVSNHYRGKDERSSSWSDMEALARKFPVGSQAACFVNPSDPDQAILQHDSLWIGIGLLVSFVFIFVGAGGIWSTWRTLQLRPQSGPLSEQASRPQAGWVMALFFGIFFLVGTGGTVALGWGFVDLVQSGSWVKTPCTVESSRVLTHSDSDGSTYSVDVLYRYSFRNQTYRSNRYSFMGGSSSGYKSKAEAVKNFPAGKNAFCYVDPKNPSNAVLHRGWTWEMLIILVPLLFAVIGLGGILYSLKPKPAQNNFPGTPLGGPASAPGSSSAFPAGQTSGGPLVLKPKTSAFAKMCGMLLVALFWNGIISIFLYQAAGSWQQGRPDWFLSLFMVPFVLIGLGIIFGVFYFMLCIGNPVAKLALNPAAIALGGKLRFGWGFEGKTDRIRNLRITLEAREEATYRRGTRSYTDKSTFYRQDLVDLSDSRQIAQGLAEAEIPSGLMHSLSSANNKIVWTLTIHGSIPRWPDVKEEFELAVLPAGKPA